MRLRLEELTEVTLTEKEWRAFEERLAHPPTVPCRPVRKVPTVKNPAWLQPKGAADD